MNKRTNKNQKFNSLIVNRLVEKHGFTAYYIRQCLTNVIMKLQILLEKITNDCHSFNAELARTSNGKNNILYQATVTSFMQPQKNAIDSVTLIDKREKTISNSFCIPSFETYTTPTEELTTEQTLITTVSNDEFEDEELAYEYAYTNSKNNL